MTFAFADEAEQRAIVRRLRQLGEFIESLHALWTIFDRATLDCLCYIAKMPRFKRSVAEYFRMHFRGKIVWLDKNYRPSEKFFTEFSNEIQHVRVCGANESLFKYVALNFPQLTKITFHDMLDRSSHVSHDQADILCDTMHTVETAVFNVHQFCGGIYDRLLIDARNNIRILIINSNSTDPNLSHNNRFCTRLYPKLTVMQWDDGIVSNPHGFERFLLQNTNVVHLIFTRKIFAVMDFLENSKLRLHRLDVRISSNDLRSIGLIFNRLNRLYANESYSQLHITCHDDRIFHYRNGFRMLQGLSGMTHNGKYIPSIGEIRQLTDLTVDSMDADDGLAAANQLNSLKNLYINRASIDAIRPFIKDSPNLMKIVIKNVKREPLDNFRWLVNRRNRWQNVQRLKIYLEEWAYCMLKPYEFEYSTNRLTILRADELLN